MNTKTILIIVGIFILILFVGIWLYFFLFGVPKQTDGVFSNFGFGDNEQTVRDLSDNPNGFVDTNATNFDGEPQALKQLTTRPVAGATFVDDAVRYVERGTGHVYEIDTTSGNEEKITGTTITRVVEAIFSPNGSRVALISDVENDLEVFAGTITKNDTGQGIIDGVGFAGGTHSVDFSASGERLLYLQKTTDGSIGHSYSFTNQTTDILFSIPLTDVTALWGDATYVYTTPSVEVFGNIYEVVGSSLQRVSAAAEGLVAFLYDNGLAITATVSGSVVSETHERGTIVQTPTELIAGKCAAGSGTSTLVCAGPFEMPNIAFPDDWYKGIVSFSDVIWKIDREGGEATVLSDMEFVTGREIDAIHMTGNNNGTQFLFVNKNDDTLWMFDATL